MTGLKIIIWEALLIRKANLDDAENIAQILVHSWQVNFRNIVPEDYLNQMSVHKITKGIRKSLEVNTLYVYEINDVIVAFVGCGSNRLQEHPEFEAELHTIHVLPDQKGKGIGKDLFEIVKVTLIEQNYTNMLISVFERNPATIFYEKLGGKFIGTRTVEYGGKQSIERLYGWNLS